MARAQVATKENNFSLHQSKDFVDFIEKIFVAWSFLWIIHKKAYLVCIRKILFFLNLIKPLINFNSEQDDLSRNVSEKIKQPKAAMILKLLYVPNCPNETENFMHGMEKSSRNFP